MTSTNLQNTTSQSNACCDSPNAVQRTAAARPIYRVSEQKDSYGVTVELPGVTRAGISLVVEDGNLKISGERAWTQPESWKRHSGWTPQSYELILSLGDEVDEEQIEASVSNGVLELVLAKKAEKQPRTIEIS